MCIRLSFGTLRAAAFGKGYQGIIPTLDQGGQKLQENIDYYKRFGGVSTETAERSAAFNAELTKIHLLTGAFARNLTADLLPQMKVLADSFLETKEKGGQFTESAQRTADVITNIAVGVAYLAHHFVGLGEAIGVAAARLDRWAHLDFKGASFIADDEAERVAKAGKDFDALIDKIRGAQQQGRVDTSIGPPEPPKKAAPSLTRAATAGDDPARKILEAALAALKASTEQEKALLANRDEYLKAIFERGDSTIQDYYAGKQAAQDQDLRRTSDNYLAEIALIDNFIKHAATQKDKAQGEKEKVAAAAREQLANIQAAGKAQQILDEQDKSLRNYGHTLDEVDAKMLELQGDTASAARIRFDNQNEILRAGLKSAVDSPTSTDGAIRRAKATQDELAAIKEKTVAQGKLNDVQTKYTLIIDQISLAQSRIDLQHSTGQITEIGAINQKAAAAQERIAQLTAEVAKYAAIANDPALVDGPVKNAAILKVEQMQLEIDKLAAQSDVLAAKFRDAFVGSSTTFLTDLISHTKTAKQSVIDLGKSLEQSISQIAAKDISERVFGKSGTLGGVPDLFAKWFGGGSSLPTAAGQVAGDAFLPGALGAGGTAAAAAATAASLTLVDAPAVALAASLAAAAVAADAFAVSAAAAAGASAASSGSSYASALAAAVSAGGSFAVGTDYVPHDMLAKIHQGEKITPAAQNRPSGKSSSNVFHINITNMPGATRASADHTAAAVGMEIRRATARTM